MVEEEVEQGVRLFILETDDTPGEAVVDEQCLLARHGVLANDGVFALDGLAPDRATALRRTLSLRDCRMNRGKTFKTLLELV